MALDVRDLACQLVSIPSVTGPAAELECARWVEPLLAAMGFRVNSYELSPDRPCLVAEIGPEGTAALCFSGHLDTVTYDAENWTFDPLVGDIVDGRLRGRGASDMKSGVAAILTAVEQVLARTPPTRRIVIVLTAAEESGCQGARLLVEQGAIPDIKAMIVAESTNNVPAWCHKGALWVGFTAVGRAAHGAPPHLGCNAVNRIAELSRGITNVFKDVPTDSVLGAPSVNISSIHGGGPVNLVPARAEMQVDLRTLPGQDHAEILERLNQLAGEGVDVHSLLDLSPVGHLPDHWWTREVQTVLGCEETRNVAYFTDASVFQQAMPGMPVLILGPGDPSLVHSADETCSIANLHEAVMLYRLLIDAWMAYSA